MPTSYDQLVQNVPIWLYAQNRDLTDNMPQIISDCEDQVFELIDHDLFQTVFTGETLSVGVDLIDLTGKDIQEVRAIRLHYREGDQYTSLERRNIEFLTMMYNENRPDRPRFYADYGNYNQLKVFPTPRENYDVEITANIQPAKLSGAVQTNVLSARFPRVYEKGCLRQAALYMKNPQDAATYGKEMQDAILEANIAIARRRRDETGVRDIETANKAGN